MPNLNIFHGSQWSLAEKLTATSAVGFDYLHPVTQVSSREENRRSVLLDLPRQTFIRTRDSVLQDYVNAWLSPAVHPSFMQGDMDGGWFINVLNDRILAFEPGRLEEFYSHPKEYRYSYFDDKGIPCAFFICPLPEGLSLSGIVRNTTAAAEEREVLIIASDTFLPFGAPCDKDAYQAFMAFLASKEIESLIQEHQVFLPDGSLNAKGLAAIEKHAKTTEKPMWALSFSAGLVCLTAAILCATLIPTGIGALGIFVFGLLAIGFFMMSLMQFADMRAARLSHQATMDQIAAEQKQPVNVGNAEALSQQGIFASESESTESNETASLAVESESELSV